MVTRLESPCSDPSCSHPWLTQNSSRVSRPTRREKLPEGCFYSQFTLPQRHSPCQPHAPSDENPMKQIMRGTGGAREQIRGLPGRHGLQATRGAPRTRASRQCAFSPSDHRERRSNLGEAAHDQAVTGGSRQPKPSPKERVPKPKHERRQTLRAPCQPARPGSLWCMQLPTSRLSSYDPEC